MKLTESTKKYIDSLSYHRLLDMWRNAPMGEPIFQDETGEYWGKRMSELREQGADHVQASKDIGWGKER
jgi:hypothetical protein